MFFFKRNEATWPSLRTFSLFREGHTLNAIYHRSLYFSCLLTGYRFFWLPRSVKHKPSVTPISMVKFSPKSLGHLLQTPFPIRQKCLNTRFESGFGAVVERSWCSSAPLPCVPTGINVVFSTRAMKRIFLNSIDKTAPQGNHRPAFAPHSSTSTAG